LAGAREVATVVAIAPDAPTAAAERSVQEAIGAHREALHPPREPVVVVGLDDEVQVVVLYRELHDPKVCATCPADCALEGVEQHLRAKAGEAAHRPHRDVQWVPVLVHRPLAMPHVRPLAGLGPWARLLHPAACEPAPILEAELDGRAVLPRHQ
jgi:hypothetical protein